MYFILINKLGYLALTAHKLNVLLQDSNQAIPVLRETVNYFMS